MTTIRLFADDQKLRVAHDGPCVVSGSRNATILHVQFGRGWSDYEKSAVFYTTRDDKVYEVLLDEGKCTIPHEVLSLTADLYIGVRGVSSEHQKVKPTSLVKYKIEKGAPVGDGTTVEPTPDVYQQILMRLNDLEVGAGGEVDPVKVTRIVEDYLAEHPSPKGDKGDPGEPGADGKDGTPGKDGKDGKSAYTYAQEAGFTGTEAEFAQDLATDNIPVPSTAQVGQYLRVTEVDADGKPVKWECVDVPAGGNSGGDKWELIANYSVEEVADSVSFSTDMNGDPFSLTKMRVFMTLPKYDYEGETYVGYANLRINGAGDYIYPASGWQSVDLIGDIEALGDICLVEWRKIPTDKHGGAAGAWGIFGGVKFVRPAGTFDDIHSFEWGLFNRKVLPGATFKIYGVRA